MRTDQLALSRSATDRDAERRSEPGLLDRLAADPGTRTLPQTTARQTGSRLPCSCAEAASWYHRYAGSCGHTDLSCAANCGLLPCCVYRFS